MRFRPRAKEEKQEERKDEESHETREGNLEVDGDTRTVGVRVVARGGAGQFAVRCECFITGESFATAEAATEFRMSYAE